MHTTLHNGRAGIRAALQIEARSPSANEIANQKSQISTLPILDFIASDESLDRFGEIISASGWRLDTYRRNPVFQNAHQYGDILFTLGKALITEVRTIPREAPQQLSTLSSQLSIPREAPQQLSTLNPQLSTVLFQRVQFATDVNPAARVAYGLYQGKFLNAVSVGFIPLRWEDVPPGGTSSAGPGTEGGGRRARRKYLEQELLEVSAVGIPANPNALALGLKAGAIEKSDLREILALLKSLCAQPREHGRLAGEFLREKAKAAVQTPAFPGEMLLFARQLQGVLRHA